MIHDIISTMIFIDTLIITDIMSEDKSLAVSDQSTLLHSHYTSKAFLSDDLSLIPHMSDHNSPNISLEQFVHLNSHLLFTSINHINLDTMSSISLMSTDIFKLLRDYPDKQFVQALTDIATY